MNQRGRRNRGPLDFPNPVDLIVEEIVWQLRWAGRRLITGVVLVAGVAVIALALFVPLLLAGLLIAVFGLAVEPYKWLGTVLIVAAFVVGVVAAPLLLRRMIRRSRRLIALTEVGDVRDEVRGLGPPPIVPTGPTREQWSAGIRALDERLGSPPEAPRPPRTPKAGDG